MTTLYDLQADMALLLAEIEEAGGEITPEQEEALEALNLSRDAKLTNWVKYLKNLDADMASLEVEIDRLKHRLEQKEQQADRAKERLGLVLGEGTNWSCPIASLSWRKSTAVEPRLPLEAMREMFVRVTERREFNKSAAKAYILGNGEIPEAVLIERLHLQVK